MNAKIKSISLQNFKGCRDKTYYFDGKNATVSGANATGKTTIIDAFWWCLFNKDSLGSEKFSIRPLDENGKMIDNVDIKVVVDMDIDGDEVEFCKTQRQKWVKKRGSDVAELQGNENLYEIDSYPKSEKDYKSAISEIVSEDVFKMITNPTHFPSLKWKEQREILMRFVTDVSDFELASGKTEFAKLLGELQKAPSTDDIKAKYQKALTEWKKKQAEIPVRIDEAEKSRVDIDVAELELQRNGLKDEISKVKSQVDDVDGKAEEYGKLKDEVMKLKVSKINLENKANEDNMSCRQKKEKEISDKRFLLSQAEKTICGAEKEIVTLKNAIENTSVQLTVAADAWKTEKKRVFDENSLVCSYCGQEYPAEKKEQLRADFETHKAKKLAEITEKGNAEKERLKMLRGELANVENLLQSGKENLEMLNAAIADLEKQLSEIPTAIDISDTEEYKTIQKQIIEKETEISTLENPSNTKRLLNNKADELQSQLTECEKLIALARKNAEIDERISELQAEQKEVAQKVADQEKMLYLLEQFIRYKMDSVSESINEKFEGINFKLFDLQINGGLKETCELTVNGVPYSSLNNGHRIIAGLQIIKALQGLYDVRMPIFTDNAESINDFNMPDMECQLVLLKVSDDKELKVENY